MTKPQLSACLLSVCVRRMCVCHLCACVCCRVPLFNRAHPLPVARCPSLNSRLTPLQLYGQLQRGNAVTSVSGRTVQPHMVMDTPTMPGPCLIIVDCPSLDYLPALKNDTTLQGLQQEARAQQQQQQERPPAEQPTDAAAGAGAEQAEQPVQKRFVLVHLGPSSISSNAEYRAWCQGFGPGAQQLFVSSDGQCCSTTRRAAELQAQLNVIEPDVFSLTGLLSLKQTTQQQQQQQEEGAQGQDVSTAGAADAAGAGTGGVVHQAADGVVIKLAPARFQGLYLDEALTQPPDLDGVQVGGWLV